MFFVVYGLTDGDPKGYVLKLNKKLLYDLKQIAFNWYEMLCKRILDRGFLIKVTIIHMFS